uniref:Bifunctional lysine-specific demethylase and histidyl-hydroxylase NO66-like n=1 Tax=Ciona intestinalis TaxID=7719 RepID=H2XKZ7_CIOIN|nr:myb-like protein L isoform X1 [Ciona intestinalis]XP_026692459.1 myb-like protein L isoform X1 [Ciona intestinalis]|eukprot:XP_018671607.2 myb-like protein L isoform X1 [Ciona intestinalis]
MGKPVNDEKCEKLVEINQVCDTLRVVDGQLRYESETSEELTIEEKGDADLRAVNEKANKNEVNESSDEWSKQEDENLMEGVEKYGLGSWNDIQDAFPLLAHKEPDACYNRWQELCKVSNHELSLQQVSTNDHGSPVYRLTRKRHIRKIFSE